MSPDIFQIGEHRFTGRDLTPGDQADLLELHRRVFDSGVAPDWFGWKYERGGGTGYGLWDEHGVMVAFCGGVPRRLSMQGREVRGIQIGDVMVGPEVRGLLTRKGPFFHVSERFYTSRIGQDRPHEVAFGFPSERHLRLAVKLDLLHDGGPIHEMRWHCEGARLPWHWRCDALDPNQAGFDTLVDKLGRRFDRAMSNQCHGIRSADYLRWRFVDRPGYDYAFHVLRRPWSSSPEGLLVLRYGGEVSQWLDWIGPPDSMPTAALAARMLMVAKGAKVLTLWGTPRVKAALAASAPYETPEVAKLGLPCASLLDPVEAARLPWWWLGGDTDFL